MTFPDPGAAIPTVGGVYHGHALSRPSRAAPWRRSAWRDGRLVLTDGTLFWGRGIGAAETRVGEVCFNTAMTGYQEILTDPSYAGQLITFTFPHIGNVGTNGADIETVNPAALGLISRAEVTPASNHRAESDLHTWLTRHRMPGLTGADTRRLTRRIRDGGAPIGAFSMRPTAIQY